MIDRILAIDDHCHIGVIKGERDGLTRFGAEEMVEMVDSTGVAKAVVTHHILSLCQQEEFRPANDLVLESTRRYPDRLYGLCVVNPRHGAFAEKEAPLALRHPDVTVVLLRMGISPDRWPSSQRSQVISRT